MCGPDLVVLESTSSEGNTPVLNRASSTYDLSSKSRVAWECSLNWVVNFI